MRSASIDWLCHRVLLQPRSCARRANNATLFPVVGLLLALAPVGCTPREQPSADESSDTRGESSPERVAFDSSAGLMQRPIETPYTRHPELLDTLGLVRRIRTSMPSDLRIGGEMMVVLNVFIDEEGRVRNAVVQRGSGTSTVDQAFLAAIRHARFRPAQLPDSAGAERPVPVWYLYPLGWPNLLTPPIPFEYRCDRWTPYPPATSPVAVDLRLRTGIEDRSPSDREVQAVRAQGGKVLHVFNVSIVRVEADTTAIRQWVSGPDAIAERAAVVRETSALEVELEVIFSRTVTDADAAAVTQAGGTVLGRAPLREPALRVRAPDPVIPSLSRLPGVKSVRTSSIGCARTR